MFGYYQSFTQGYDAINKFFGRPSPARADVLRVQCLAEMTARGVVELDKDGNFRETVMNRLRDAAQEWILLAQFDSDVDTGVLWGDDGGRIYYLIRKA
ncbi:MAG: YwqG family protein, partial [Nitrospinota bacterium]|nr:YwqG family protein [Nitrospinota bacterium]